MKINNTTRTHTHFPNIFLTSERASFQYNNTSFYLLLFYLFIMAACELDVWQTYTDF